MRTTELVLIVLIVLGCIFKIQHWPGANAFILVGGGTLALFYFPFGFRTLAAPRSTDQILWFTLLGGLALNAALSGLLAFQLRWPYNKELLVIGAIGCAVTLLSGVVLRYKHPRMDIYLEGMLIRCLVLGGLAFMLWGLFAGKPR
ncbi:MAG TPA: hypothetical protein PL010_15670 [Flavobacteriales bacterium]|nr:hypothetical protein [Flavobacteriales bacterium]HMW95845.1 hypothetical protein [Flavobacteriales bacterium]HMZ49974.1 hypothetical protein [Flavobacteriales bacterium]HNA34685.1 hypothetical protein [Flavobacteriales bacterium]HNE79120.1 hypothetical protein [Flavobacteriales bacterium]